MQPNVTSHSSKSFKLSLCARVALALNFCEKNRVFLSFCMYLQPRTISTSRGCFNTAVNIVSLSPVTSIITQSQLFVNLTVKKRPNSLYIVLQRDYLIFYPLFVVLGKLVKHPLGVELCTNTTGVKPELLLYPAVVTPLKQGSKLPVPTFYTVSLIQ